VPTAAPLRSLLFMNLLGQQSCGRRGVSEAISTVRIRTDVARGNQVFPVARMDGFHVSGYATYHPVVAADSAKDLTATASSSMISKTVYSLVICIRS